MTDSSIPAAPSFAFTAQQLASPDSGQNDADHAMMAEMMQLLQESQQIGMRAVAAPVPVAQAAGPMPDGQRDLQQLLQAGGEQAIALLQYSVRSINLDPLFVLLVAEFQMRPTHQAALAIYDYFCAPGALLALSLPQEVASHALRLKQQIEGLRREWQQLQAAAQLPRIEGQEAPALPRSSVPLRSMFDGLVNLLKNQPHSGYNRAARSYDPGKSVSANLPGGEMTPAQRNFIAGVWLRQARPGLLAAGFWRLGSIE